jgi:hypothetical protein
MSQVFIFSLHRNMSREDRPGSPLAFASCYLQSSRGKPMTILRVTRRTFVAVLGSAAAYALIVGLTLLASSMWLSHPEAHDLYTMLTDGNGASCCNGSDCRPARYRTTAAGVEMLVNGHWILVPNGKIQYRTLEGDTGETAGGHWCGVLDFEVTYCAILPPRSSSTSGESPPNQSVRSHHLDTALE